MISNYSIHIKLTMCLISQKWVKMCQIAEVICKVIQGHQRLCHFTGHMSFPIRHPLEIYLYLVWILRYKHLFAIILTGHMTLTMLIWGTVCYLKANTSHGQPMHKIRNLYFQPFWRYLRRVWNSQIVHAITTTPISEMICHRQAWTCWD